MSETTQPDPAPLEEDTSPEENSPDSGHGNPPPKDPPLQSGQS